MANEPETPPPPGPARPESDPDRSPGAGRVVALVEIALCSGFPTQLALVATLAALGYTDLTVGFVVTLSLADTVLVLGLLAFFIGSHGERPRTLFLADRPIGREALLGVPLIFVALGLALATLLTVHQIAPWLRPPGRNPLEALVTSPQAALLFAVVVVLAGGVREELQRAFILRRFDWGLGGPKVGVPVGSLAFGAGHLLQGGDAAIATGLLGMFWAVTYLRRGSVVAPLVSHAGFNLLQLLQILLLRS